MANRLLDEGERGSEAPENILFHFFACILYSVQSIQKFVVQYSTMNIYLDPNKKKLFKLKGQLLHFSLFLSVGSADPDTKSDSGSGSRKTKDVLRH
jgi:hypothetical protein